MTRLLATLAAAALISAPLRADLITYTWDDRGSNSGFAGSFAIDTALMTPAPGGLMRYNFGSITRSEFSFSRGLPMPVTFAIIGLTPGDFLVDPTTGAIHSGARLTFGPSTTLTTAPFDGYQITGGAVSFFSGANSIAELQFAYLSDNAPPDGEFLASIGRWEATVVPAPPALVLLAGGGLLLGTRRLSRLLRGSGRVHCRAD